MPNPENLVPLTSQKAREIGKKGGVASGRRRREKKTVAQALRMVLDEPVAKGASQTKLDAITAKVVKNLFDNPDIRDVKVLAELLGELTHTIEAEGMTINISSSEQGRTNIEKILEGGE